MPEHDNKSFDKEAWLSQKNESRKEAFEMLDKATVELSSPKKLIQYLEVQSRLSLYSVSNALLVSFQKPEASRIGDSAYWQKNGATITAGEKALSILESKEFTRSNGKHAQSYDVKKVFDITQTSASDRTFSHKQYGEKTLVNALIRSLPCEVDISNNLPDDVKAQFVPNEETIYIRQGMSGSEIFQSLITEASKSIYAHKDLSDNDKNVAVFCTAYIVCTRAHVTPPENSLVKTFDSAEPKDIRKMLADIRTEAIDISSSIEKQLSIQRDAR